MAFERWLAVGGGGRLAVMMGVLFVRRVYVCDQPRQLLRAGAAVPGRTHGDDGDANDQDDCEQ